VIPAAGAGSRFAETHPGVAKPLIEVLGRPMIDLVVRNCDAKDGDTLIVIGRMDTGLREWRPKFTSNVKYEYLEVSDLTRGPACTLQFALPAIPNSGPIVSLNADQFVLGGLKKFVEKLKSLADPSALILTMIASGSRWSYVKVQDNLVMRVEEKLEISDEATVGVYGWTSKKLLGLALDGGMAESDMVNGEWYVAPTYNYLISKHVPVERYLAGSLADTVVGMGTPEDLETALKSEKFRTEVSLIF
jgi:NDP-sugar pyrophosphorylase family protein